MKSLKMIASVICLFCGSSVLAQNTGIASVAASVVTPITMMKEEDMNFGNAAVSSSHGGYVTLAPGGARSSGGSGVTLPATGGTITAARFTITGAPGFTYAITLPASAVISGPGAATMNVNSFTSSPAATGILSAGGAQSLNVGATLNIAPGQAAGTYTNVTAIPVTVNYN